ncbi:MAG: nucleotide exchange factor GrpE [Erysipelothrix sp.]|nr:nucleotide exchange factor GrpE [Erysipelothrix sp.]
MKNENEDLEVESIIEEVEEVVEEIDELSSLQNQVDELQSALENEQANFLKAHADLENTKRRITNDFNQRDKYKNQSFMLALLPAIDNMEKVLSEDSDNTSSLKEAIDMIYRQLMNSLESEGVVEIAALNEKFDPNIHHAVMVEVVEGVEADIVLEVLQKGYMIKDRVLRPSMVKVSQ